MHRLTVSKNMSVWVRKNRWFWFNGHPYLTIGMNLTMSGLSVFVSISGPGIDRPTVHCLLGLSDMSLINGFGII